MYVVHMKTTEYTAGLDLLEYSRKVDHSEKFGPITKLFPYIYEASQRMGVREISRWLSDNKKVSVSPSTISRALRFPEPQWEGFSSIVEPYMRTIEEFAGENSSSRRMYFAPDEKEFEENVVSDRKEFETALEPNHLLGQSCLVSIDFLYNAWFSLEQSTRAKCYQYLMDEEGHEE